MADAPPITKATKARTTRFLRALADAGYWTADIMLGGVTATFDKRSEDGPRINGWPAVWGILEKFGVSYGCGSSHWHQCEWGSLVPGHYDLRKPRRSARRGRNKTP